MAVALWLVPAVMLILALGPWPYGYYVLLRLVVCLAAAFIAWSLRTSTTPLTWAFVCLAILYNPIVKVPLGREVWMVLNVISVLPFGIVGWKSRNSAPRHR